MSQITLTNLCLDFVTRTGSESLKKTLVSYARKLIPTEKNRQLISKVKHTRYRALNQINLEINAGDRVGIIGHNGAGKSTLLRVLAKIYTPTSGHIEVQGSVANLFDVNLGMNVEATGYENIINLAVMRGIKKRLAYGMISNVEEFTELGQFLNFPVQTYSTGMQMKLAFAAATLSSADILLIDEIIGAGDFHFMDKATKRLESAIEKAKILVITAHSNDIIRRFCNRIIVLNKGTIQFDGPVDEGIAFYEQSALSLTLP
jgi:ABC-2 type transport system ATP-binding protein/lipopolysaccharide transport system ATP-binding protein